MRHVIAYAGTRNVYPCMAAAAKSALRECKRIDRIWFLIEDDAFPEQLPDVIRCVNVKNDPFAMEQGPNYTNPWTYMVMARCILHNLLPDEERVLYLDVDTIAMFAFDELFEADLQGNVIGAVREPKRCLEPFVYHNAGVLLMDLQKLRDTGIGDEILRMLQTRKLKCPDQDAINLLCQGRMLELNPIYNASDWTQCPPNAKIYHYAGDPNYTQRKLFQSYMNMKWSDLHAREK